MRLYRQPRPPQVLNDPTDESAVKRCERSRLIPPRRLRWMSHILVLGSLLCSACIGFPPVRPYHPVVPPEAIESLGETLELPNRTETVEALESLVERYPNFVEAHRNLQNFYLEDNRQGYLLNRYGSCLRNAPDDPTWNYLFGRLLMNPERQVECFLKAVRRDPSFFWGYNGLGFAQRRAGRYDESEDAFRRGILSDSNRVEPYQGMITIHLAKRELEEADALLKRGIARFPRDPSLRLLEARYVAEKEGPLKSLDLLIDQPEEVPLTAEYFRVLLDTLDRTSNDESLRRILYRFGTVAERVDGEDDGFGGSLNLLLGICSRRLANLSGAYRYFSRVYSETLPALRARRELRYLHCVSGRLEEALALATVDCPPEWVKNSRYHELGPRIVGLAESLHDAHVSEADMLELADLLTRLGWLDEAAFYYARIAQGGHDAGRTAAKRLETLYRHGRFEMALRDYFLHSYREFTAKGVRRDLDDVLKALSALSLDILGEDIFEVCEFLDYSPAGELLDIRDETRSSATAYFKKFNRFFLLGRKSGGPLEAYLLDVFDVRSGVTLDVAGETIEFDLVRCENLRIPSLIEFSGGSIAGAGLHSLLILNIDALRHEVGTSHDIYARFREREDALLNDPPPSVDLLDDVKDVTESLGLSTRLRYLSYRDFGARKGDVEYMRAAFDALLRHEVLHLADARKFLPFSKNLIWKVFEFASRGFSRFNVEAWLEERAQLYALYRARDRRFVLAGIVDFVAPSVFESPHRQGYRTLLVRIVDHIHERPEGFPCIDPEKGIVHQLHLLNEDRLAEIAEFLADEYGITDTSTDDA